MLLLTPPSELACVVWKQARSIMKLLTRCAEWSQYVVDYIFYDNMT